MPGARRDVPIRLARALLIGHPANIEFTRDEYLAHYQYFFDVLNKDRQFIALSFSPSRALCKTGICAVSLDGNPLYFDDNHVTKSSAPYWLGVLERAESQSEAQARGHGVHAAASSITHG